MFFFLEFKYEEGWSENNLIFNGRRRYNYWYRSIMTKKWGQKSTKIVSIKLFLSFSLDGVFKSEFIVNHLSAIILHVLFIIMPMFGLKLDSRRKVNQVKYLYKLNEVTTATVQFEIIRNT